MIQSYEITTMLLFCIASCIYLSMANTKVVKDVKELRAVALYLKYMIAAYLHLRAFKVSHNKEEGQ